MTDKIEQVIFDVAEALLVPVLILALLALAVVVYELGRLRARAAQQEAARLPAARALGERRGQLARSG